jgi:hypothetical protein
MAVKSVILNKEGYSTAGGRLPVALGDFFDRVVEECVRAIDLAAHNMVEIKREFIHSVKPAWEVTVDKRSRIP